MAKLPWMPFFGRDFFGDEKVKLFNQRQIGFYMQLLWHQWEHGTIPASDECLLFPCVGADLHADRMRLKAILGNSNLSQLEALAKLAQAELLLVHERCFKPHPTEGNRFYNPRLEEIRRVQREKDVKYQERARKGGLARQAELRAASSSAQAQPKSANQNQSQIQKKKKDEEKKSSPNGADKESAAAAKVTWKDLVERWNQIPGVQKSNVQLLKGTKLPDLINTRLHDHPDPSWWSELFEIVGRSPFLCGKVKPAKGKKLFRASLYWALGVENLTKVLSEQYVDHGSGGAHDIDAEWGQTGKFAESFKNWGNEPEAVVADGGPGAGDAGGA